MAYPGAKVHRINRRKLGRGQYPAQTAITATITYASPTITVTFSDQVVVSGIIPVSISPGVIGTQTIVSPTVVTYNNAALGTAVVVTLPAMAANVIGLRGQAIAGASAIV